MQEYYELQLIIDKIYNVMKKRITTDNQLLKINVILSTQIIKRESRWDNQIFLIGLKILEKTLNKACLDTNCFFCSSKKFETYWLEVYLICLLVAQKMYDDYSLSNREIVYIYQKLNREFKLNLELLNKNEICLLKHLDWNLIV